MPLKQAVYICVAFFVLLCFILPLPGGHDTMFWVNWIKGMQKIPFAQCYTIDTLNYNPLYLYFLNAYGTIVPENAVHFNINYLKIFTLLFDVGAILFLIRWLSKNNTAIFNAFFILFNVAYLYNTLWWGQIDAMYTTLGFVAIVAAIEKRFITSILFFLVAVNVKTQAIIFFSVLALIWLPLLRGQKLSLYIKTGLLVIFLQAIIFLPFIIAGTLSDIWHNYINVSSYYKVVSLKAYNFWFICMWENNSDILYNTPITNTFIGITYKIWGILLFFLFTVIALLPLLIKTLLYSIKGKSFSFANAEQLFLGLTLGVLAFFFFLTQMHERYAHPAILFAGIYFVLSRRWLIFLLTSYAYVMSLETSDKCWKLNYGTLIFDPRLLASVYAIAIVLGIWYMYKRYNFKGDWVELKEGLFNKHRVIQ